MKAIKIHNMLIISMLTMGGVISSCGSKPVNGILDSHFEADGTPHDSTRVYFTPQLPESVRLYVETSGSMNGFFRAHKANNFKKTVWSVFSGLEPLTDGKVYPMSVGGTIDSPLTLPQFRADMNAGAFVSGASTQVPAMLATIMEGLDTSRNEVAVLVSDMKFSPTGKSAAPELLQYEEMIRNLFGQNKNVAVAYVCAVSEFISKDGSEATDRSPYFFIILGNSENVAEIRNNISSWCEATRSYVWSGAIGMNYKTPQYSLQNLNQGLRDDRYPTQVVRMYDPSLSDTLSFVIRVNLEGYPWEAVNQQALSEAFQASTLHGAGIKTHLLTDSAHLVDDHAYKDEFKRKAYADFQVNVFNFMSDGDVVEWSLNPRKFNLLSTQEFNSIISATDENDPTGAFSFDQFISGCFGGHINSYNEEPVRILISKE